MIKIKTGLKPDTDYDQTVYHQMYLALFQAAYGLTSANMDSPTSIPLEESAPAEPLDRNDELPMP